MGFDHDIVLFESGKLKNTRNPKLKCPVCRKISQFRQFDVNCESGIGYIEGQYSRLYRCEKCHVIVAKQEKELNTAGDGK